MNNYRMQRDKEYLAENKLKSSNEYEYEDRDPDYNKTSVRWTRANLHLLKLCRDQGLIFTVKKDIENTVEEAEKDQDDAKVSTSQ